MEAEKARALNAEEAATLLATAK
jgi:integrase